MLNWFFRSVLRQLEAHFERQPQPLAEPVDWGAIASAERWLDEKYFELENKRLDLVTARNSSFLTATSGVAALFVSATLSQIKALDRHALGIWWMLLVAVVGIALALLVASFCMGLTTLLGSSVPKQSKNSAQPNRGHVIFDPPTGEEFFQEMEQKAELQGISSAEVNRQIALLLRNSASSYEPVLQRRFARLKLGAFFTSIATGLLAATFFSAWVIGSTMGSVMSTESNSNGASQKPAAPTTNLVGRPTQKGQDGVPKPPPKPSK